MLLSSFTGNLLEAGCDEAGRGCLAGPVVAAAVILPKDFSHPVIDDSKKLSHIKRVELRRDIEKEAIAWAIGEVWNREIDEINILNASFLAMHRAISRLVTKPEFLLIDGNRFKPFHGIAHECIIKGDGKYFAIASASIIAKTHRDQLMTTLAMKYPQYKWDSNKGYPTLEHREQIRKFGITEYHRKTFRLLPDQLELFD